MIFDEKKLFLVNTSPADKYLENHSPSENDKTDQIEPYN